MSDVSKITPLPPQLLAGHLASALSSGIGGAMTSQLPGSQGPPHCPRTGLARVGVAGRVSSPGSSRGWSQRAGHSCQPVPWVGSLFLSTFAIGKACKSDNPVLRACHYHQLVCLFSPHRPCLVLVLLLSFYTEGN